jgi:hypothetical protein
MMDDIKQCLLSVGIIWVQRGKKRAYAHAQA